MSTDVGAVYRTTLEVLNASGVPTAPATNVLTVTLPDQTTATPAITTDSAGEYHVDYPITQEGLYKFAWVTTGPITSKTDYENGTAFRSVIGLQEARDYLKLDDDSQDEMLRQIMGAATELAESVVGTCVIRTFTNEQIPGYTRSVIRLPHGPLPNNLSVASITSVWASGPVWLTAALSVYPNTGTCEPLNMQGFWLGPWLATYTAGRTVIPQRVVLAVKEIIWDLWAPVRGLQSDQQEPGLEETSQFDYQLGMLPNYTMPVHARALLEAEASPGFA